MSLALVDSICAENKPVRIAVAGGSLTEILFFIGAEEYIVATDSTSNFPPKASEFPSIGYVRNLSAEGLMSLSPSLILGEEDMGPPAIFDQLKALEVEVIRLDKATSAEGIIDKVMRIGQIVDRQAEAVDFVASQLEPMRQHLATELLQVKRRPKVLLLLSMNSGAPIAAGAKTSGQFLLDMAGADNVVQFEGWKPISTEALIALQPDYIVLTDRTISTAGGIKQVKNIPVMAYLEAAQNDRIIIMDGMYLLGFGPRTIQAALEIASIWHPEIIPYGALPFKRGVKGG